MISLLLFSWLNFALAQETPVAEKGCTLEIAMTGTIGPANLDLLERSLKRATDYRCGSLLMLVNTPGGSLQSTRLIVERILNSPVPVLCLVAPSGAHAGSAGAIILQACHVNGAMEATNLGAATPVAGGGVEIPEDLKKKIMNDTRSWMETITRLRGRSEKFGQDIVTEAKAVSADEAKKLGAIDAVVTKVDDFLEFAAGRTVKMSENISTQVKVGERRVFEPDWRYKALDLFTDPQTAYLVLMGSLALIYFEVTHPGTMVPGVLGGIGLVVALVALHKLDVEWGGLALILLGIIFMIAEAFVPSFGILGIGGLASFIIGSLLLFDPAETGGYRLPLSLILPTAVTIGLIMMGVGLMVLRTYRVRTRGGFEDLIGETGVIVTVADGRAGQMEILGETWAFESAVEIREGQKVKVSGHKGLTLKVEPSKEE
jgi:membrane-bound serine protease (ClpP class)